jgi:uncharacterized protein (TIGR03437 family)
LALFGNGFDANLPDAVSGQFLSSPLPLIAPVQVTIGDQPAQVMFVGQVGPGLYQVNVVVPAVDTKYRNFDVPVILSVSGSAPRAT